MSALPTTGEYSAGTALEIFDFFSPELYSSFEAASTPPKYNDKIILPTMTRQLGIRYYRHVVKYGQLAALCALNNEFKLSDTKVSARQSRTLLRRNHLEVILQLSCMKEKLGETVGNRNLLPLEASIKNIDSSTLKWFKFYHPTAVRAHSAISELMVETIPVNTAPITASPMWVTTEDEEEAKK